MSAATTERGPGPLSKVINMSPSDIALITRRVYDHVIEKRTSPEETRMLISECGYGSIEEFCSAVGLPAHIAQRWCRLGISGEMRLVLMHMRDRQRLVKEAVDDFESMTHVGVDDFLQERGVL